MILMGITTILYEYKRNDIYSMWNRDVNGATNIFRIVKNIIDKKERPKYLCR